MDRSKIELNVQHLFQIIYLSIYLHHIHHNNDTPPPSHHHHRDHSVTVFCFTKNYLNLLLIL
jgi:hypothetical protein